jgi:hypothetical protein
MSVSLLRPCAAVPVSAQTSNLQPSCDDGSLGILTARRAWRCGKTHNPSIDAAAGSRPVEIAADVRNATAGRWPTRHAGVDLPPWWRRQSQESDDMTIIRKVDPIDTNELSKAPATVDADGPAPIAGAELDRVAAAGGKGGASGGDVRCRHTTRPQ